MSGDEDRGKTERERSQDLFLHCHLLVNFSAALRIRDTQGRLGLRRANLARSLCGARDDSASGRRGVLQGAGALAKRMSLP